MHLPEILGTETPSRYRWVRRVITLRRPFALGAAALAGFGLIRSLSLTKAGAPPGDAVLTHPFTALAIGWIGLGTFLHKQGQQSPIFKKVVSLGFLCLSFAILFGHAIGRPVLESARFGHVAPDTAAILGCFFSALLLRRRSPGQGLLLLALGSALTVIDLVSKSYLVPLFGGKVSLSTAFALLFCQLAVTTLYVHLPVLRVVFLDDVIGARTRRLLFASVAIPWFLGALPIMTAIDAAESASTMTVATALMIWTFAVMSVHTGYLLERADHTNRLAQRKLGLLASRDELTRLYNRYAMSILLSRRLEAFAAGGNRVGLMILDLDHFKNINDRGGHDIGDLVLSAVGGALKRFRRNRAIAGRWGGEEFIVVFDVEKDADLAEIPLEIHRLIGALEPVARRLDDKGDHRGKIWPVTASIGVTRAFDGEQSRDSLLKRADVALYAAKENGRNRVEFHAEFLPIRAA